LQRLGQAIKLGPQIVNSDRSPNSIMGRCRGFGQFFESLRINAVLDVRSINSDENDLPSALDRELGIWTDWNILKFYLRGCGSRNLTFLSCPWHTGCDYSLMLIVRRRR
jgi:hypothetical protein